MCSLFLLVFSHTNLSFLCLISILYIPSLSFPLQSNLPYNTNQGMSSSSWFLSYTKLRFFIRIRRFLTLKTSKRCSESEPSENSNQPNPMTEDDRMTKSEDCSYFLQRSVKQLHFGSSEDKATAAKEISRLANKDIKTRKSLATLGVIPSLVNMMDSDVKEHRRVAVLALIELANGTYTNKALIVEAGIFSKLPGDIDALDYSSKHDYALLLLSISSLSDTQFPISLSNEVLQFLVGILHSSDTSIEAKMNSLDALYNLSSTLENVGHLVSDGVVHTLLNLTSEKETSEKALAILGNLVVSIMGKKVIENDAMVPASLIEIMTWESKPKCQELAAYILMILAHQSSKQRAKMAELGIVQVLLELALLGSSLAQKRALKLLQWFKDERQTRIGAHSGPQAGRVIAISPQDDKTEISQGRKIIKKMVKQSLDKNMELIMRRANCVGESSKLKSFVISSSSKSLPY